MGLGALHRRREILCSLERDAHVREQGLGGEVFLSEDEAVALFGKESGVVDLVAPARSCGQRDHDRRLSKGDQLRERVGARPGDDHVRACEGIPEVGVQVLVLPVAGATFEIAVQVSGATHMEDLEIFRKGRQRGPHLGVDGLGTLAAAEDQDRPAPGVEPELPLPPSPVSQGHPAGRFHAILPFTHCITRYSKQKNAGRDFIRFVMNKKNYERYILVQKGYGLGATPDWENHPFWKEDLAVEPYRLNAKYGRNFGHAGPFNRQASEVQVKYIIVDLFARVAKGDSTQSSIAQTERELKLVYG